MSAKSFLRVAINNSLGRKEQAVSSLRLVDCQKRVYPEFVVVQKEVQQVPSAIELV